MIYKEKNPDSERRHVMVTEMAKKQFNGWASLVVLVLLFICFIVGFFYSFHLLKNEVQSGIILVFVFAILAGITSFMFSGFLRWSPIRRWFFCCSASTKALKRKRDSAGRILSTPNGNCH